MDTSSSPQQLIVPISIGKWRGKAIIGTGASYTLIHEYLWREVKGSNDLQPWTEGPLYLANGEAATPHGWGKLSIDLHGVVSNLPVAVLGPKALAYGIVLGLTFIYSVGMIISVADKKYSFKSNPSILYPFQPGSATCPQSSLSLISAVPPPLLSLEPVRMDVKDYIDVAVRASHLQEQDKIRLRHLLESKPHVCTNQPGRTDVLQHTIYTTNGVPIKQRPYWMSPVKQTIVEEQLRDMLANGVIETSHSGWASPVVLPPKKDGGHRFCVDFRKVNAVTETDAYPLPNLNEILESLSGSTVFSTIDLNSGYWQVPMDPNSKAKTAFITHRGLYQFNVMPFGLKNAPATFQRLMEKVLDGLQGKICLVYLDDIIVYSSSVTQHFERLQTVLDRLCKANLTLNLRKSRFCLKEIKFLGHIVSEKGVRADHDKIEAIRTYPVPTNLKEVQRFLGLAGWYHKFVQDFSKIAQPLNDLKKKGRPFVWSHDCQHAFEQLKSTLSSPPILGHPNTDLPFSVYTDASDVGLGAVLTQKMSSGMEEVLAYASRTLNRAERNYSATEKECLAVIWSLEKWQHYLEPKLFTVITDHSALKWVLSSTKTTSRLIRWALRLQRFNFIVEYRKGKLNSVPDALSRIPSQVKCCLYSKHMDDDIPISCETIKEEQQKDPAIEQIIKQLAERDDKVEQDFAVLDDKVYHKTKKSENQFHYRLYIPRSLIPQILLTYHENPLSGHAGIFKTYKRLYEVAYWPGLWTDVKHFIKQCTVCQSLKSDSQKLAGKLQHINVTRPNEMLGIDLMGPLPRSPERNEYLLVVVDYYTRWVELTPLRTATAQTVARFLRKDIFTRWGVPDYILSDRGPQFVSSVFQELCEQWTVTPKLTTAYHPQTNMTERVNRTLKCMIASYVDDNHSKWDQYLPEFRFAINSAVQETTGVTPAELQIGRKLNSPMDKVLKGRTLSPDEPAYGVVHQLVQLKADVEENMKKSRKRQLRNYNKNRRTVGFQPKQRVWVRAFPQSKAAEKFTAKLAKKWKGPYRVVRQLGPLNYQVVLEDTGLDMKTVHVCNLKPFYPSAEDEEQMQRQKVLDMLQERSDEEDFLGF